ncbi:MAG: DUF3109 family protein [Bacteroidales bacterium]
MISIENTLVSLDVIETEFVCNVSKCKGACCVEGDSGPPLTESENEKIREIFPAIKQKMKPKSVIRAQHHGISYLDQENERVAMIHENSGECIFAVQENGITKCIIENLYFDGKLDFRKPLSCHLYPIRIKSYHDFIAVNYDRWQICNPGLEQGKKQGVPLYKFAKEPLIRRFSTDWYAQLEVAAMDLTNKNTKNF